MPWPPLVAGCLVSGCVGGITVLSARFQQPDLLLGVTRLGFVPALAGLAFLAHERHRQLTGALPVPGWLPMLLRAGLALPVLASTCVLDLGLAARGLAHVTADVRPRPAFPGLGLAAEFGACCAITLAVAAVVERCRWQDLGGAIAAPASLALLAAIVLSPLRLLPGGTATAQRPDWQLATVLWVVLGISGLLLAGWSGRDPWRRKAH